MSGNTFGSIFKISTFGESHGEGIGVIIDGVPSGIKIDTAFIQNELDRRKPGQSKYTTSRNEADTAEILSGVFEGVSTGTPIAIVIRNTNQHSKDYSNVAATYRPGHADFSFDAKYGRRDYRGGGRSSGRETAARVAAGAIAKLILKEYNITVEAGALSIGNVIANKINFTEVEESLVRSLDLTTSDAMAQEIANAAANNDSVGGRVLCHITGVPAGLGEPVFDKYDALLAQGIISLGAVKAIEFGIGSKFAQLTGSQSNDPMGEGKKFLTNNAGGILGGISTGEEIIFSLTVKPTPSISMEQDTSNQDGQAVKLKITGRHDPCIVPRIIPVVEAMAAIVTADLLLRQRSAKI
jgi:chorismate synthase